MIEVSVEKGGGLMVGEVSRFVALAWGAEVAPQRGPKRELSLERIVDAAVEIADAEGLQAVTMQRVAQTFGYTTMAMYRYVASKEDLHRLMFDAAGRGELVVDDEDWRAGLAQLCAHLRGMYVRHPWLLDIPLSMEALLMPEQVRIADAGLRAMRTLRVTSDERLLILMSLSTYVRGYASMAQEVAGSDSGAGEVSIDLVREMILGGRYPDLAPMVESGVYMGLSSESSDQGPDDDDFELGLRILIEGIAAVEDPTVDCPDATALSLPDAPEAALNTVEHELASTEALRKATQRRVRELEKREADLRKRREAAKEAAEAAAKLQR